MACRPQCMAVVAVAAHACASAWHALPCGMHQGKPAMVYPASQQALCWVLYAARGCTTAAADQMPSRGVHKQCCGMQQWLWLAHLQQPSVASCMKHSGGWTPVHACSCMHCAQLAADWVSISFKWSQEFCGPALSRKPLCLKQVPRRGAVLLLFP